MPEGLLCLFVERQWLLLEVHRIPSSRNELLLFEPHRLQHLAGHCLNPLDLRLESFVAHSTVCFQVAHPGSHHEKFSRLLAELRRLLVDQCPDTGSDLFLNRGLSRRRLPWLLVCFNHFLMLLVRLLHAEHLGLNLLLEVYPDLPDLLVLLHGKSVDCHGIGLVDLFAHRDRGRCPAPALLYLLPQRLYRFLQCLYPRVRALRPRCGSPGVFLAERNSLLQCFNSLLKCLNCLFCLLYALPFRIVLLLFLCALLLFFSLSDSTL